MTPPLRPGDVVLTRSRTGWLGPAIRWFQRRAWDEDVRYNHAAIVTSLTPTPIASARIVEALWRVRGGRLWDFYGPKAGKNRPEILVFRVCSLTDAQRMASAVAAEAFVGRKYGWRKLLAHAADRWLSSKAGREVFAFRVLLERGEQTPICSLLVQHAIGDAVDFGVPPGAASPDDLDDFRLLPGKAVVLYQGVLGS
jgi:hypothetical protein